MSFIRAAAAAAVLAATVSATTTRRQAVSQKSCAQLIEDGQRFSWNHGNTDVCAAVRLPGDDGKDCFVSSESFDSAKQMCESIGARLCTSDELDRDVAAGIGCRVAQPSSYCWVSDTDGDCPSDHGYLARCKHINNPLKSCMPWSFAGTAVCCADGNLDDPLPESRSVCSTATCGAACAELDGCGWSRTRNKCIEGGTTSVDEMAMGDCTEEELNSGCSRHTCGADCADDDTGACTWSRNRMACVEGDPSTTSNAERRMGDCPGADPDDVDPELSVRKECKDVNCAFECHAPCGWNQRRMLCVNGAHTTAKEVRLGMCKAGYTAPPTPPGTVSFRNDPCDVHKCGEDCFHADGCGWASKSQRCVTGARTSQRERTMGLCPNIVVNNHFCKQFLCGAQCAAYPGCGWSTRRMMCLAGHHTSNKEMAMCSGDERVDESTVATDTGGDGGSAPVTSAPVTSAPVNSAPVTSSPATSAPVTSAPVTSAPVTQAPVTSAPVTSAPVTSSPVAPTGSCSDRPSGWTDSDGDSCAAYASKNYCNADGSYAAGWGNVGHTYLDFESQGATAATACCSCGGGSTGVKSARNCDDLGYEVTNSPNMTHVCASSVDEDGECFTFNSMAATWEDARDACDAVGARLCTAVELWSNVAQGTGCRSDKFLIWGSDLHAQCPSGQHFAGYGRVPFLGSGDLVAGCRPSADGAAIRCCADV